jgi:hypothetical protein
MGNIEHLPERLAVMAWDRHANPDGVRSTRNMALREGEVEYVRADLHRGAVEALRAIAADPQLGGTGHPVDVLARTALEALGLDPTRGQS